MRAKRLGAYYTAAEVAAFLAAWAIRSPGDTALDPSFGGGVFLTAAARRLAQLGGRADAQVFGVELEPDAHARVQLERSSAAGTARLLRADFFDIGPTELAPVDAIIGNPPFIRHQGRARAERAKALERAAAQGVTLSPLASVWAPFVAHGCALLRPGGRLAMVVPAELGHASYARPLLAYLLASFGRVTLLSFRQPLFPALSQDTLLLLAEAKGGGPGGLALLDLESARDLAAARAPEALVRAATALEPDGLLRGAEKLSHHWLSASARRLYQSLRQHPKVARLGALAEVGIGYVTGANQFFHLSRREAQSWRLSPACLKPAVYRGKALSGLRFTAGDWAAAAARGLAGYLFSLDRDRPPPEAARYLAHGEALGVSERFKCRERSPWYAVPRARAPEMLLSYMSGLRPLLVANEAGAVAPNSLHLVSLRRGAPPAGQLALAWHSSLSLLSAELEGHALGGGMLKLEPREAQNVVLALAPEAAGAALAPAVEAALRRGELERASELVDARVLRDALGLDAASCDLLRSAAEALRQRRYFRGKR